MEGPVQPAHLHSLVMVHYVKFYSILPASMAQLDARLTEDQEVAGSTLIRSATFIRRDWSWNTFYGHSLPSADTRRAVVSF